MPQLLTTPRGLDGFTPFRDIPTGRMGWWRTVDGIQYYVMPPNGSLAVSPLTCLDADAFAALTYSGPGYRGVLDDEVRHQGDSVTGNSEELKEIIREPRADASTSIQTVDQLLKRHSLVDGSSFVTPALVLGLCILGAAILYLIGRLKSRE